MCDCNNSNNHHHDPSPKIRHSININPKTVAPKVTGCTTPPKVSGCTNPCSSIGPSPDKDKCFNPFKHKHDNKLFTKVIRKDLVSDDTDIIPAKFNDANLINAWGLFITDKIWVSSNVNGTVNLYDLDGKPNPVIPLVDPTNIELTDSPSGLVQNKSDIFVHEENKKYYDILWFAATEGGRVYAYIPNLAKAIVVFDNNATGAIYKGIEQYNGLLYLTNFVTGYVDVIDKHYKLIKSFTDERLPLVPIGASGWAPFNIKKINGHLFVTFAAQDQEKVNDLAGPGNGFVDIFDYNGKFIKRIISAGYLNSPWALLEFSNFHESPGQILLVGNHGDGKINIYDLCGNFVRQLKECNGHTLNINGLWGLAANNRFCCRYEDRIIFSAGPEDENHGLLGSLNKRCHCDCVISHE